MVLFTKLLEERKNNTLKHEILNIDLDNIQSKSRLNYIEQIWYEKTKSVNKLDLTYEWYVHYQLNPLIYWKIYLPTLLSKITNIVFLYTTSELMPNLFPNPQKNNIHICAILMYSVDDIKEEVYGYALGSNTFCGGKLLNYYINNFKNSNKYKWLVHHCYNSLVPYYEKYNFKKTKYYTIDMFWRKYPFMYQATNENNLYKYNFKRLLNEFNDYKWYIIKFNTIFIFLLLIIVYIIIYLFR